MNNLKMITLCTILVLLIISGAQAQGTTSTSIGSADLRALIMLHPAMIDFEPTKEAFRIDISKLPDRQVQARRDAHKKHLHDLRTKQRTLQTRMTEELRRHDRDLSRLASAYIQRLTQINETSKETENYSIQRHRKDSEIQAKIREINEQLNTVNTELRRLEFITFDDGYTSPEETRQKFVAIVSEVRAFTQHVASQKAIQIVLNSSHRRHILQRPEFEKKPERMMIHTYRDLFETSYYSDEFSTEGHDFASEYYDNVAATTLEWLSKKNSILNNFEPELTGVEIVHGGTDLTYDILIAIYKKYKINEQIGNLIARSATYE